MIYKDYQLYLGITLLVLAILGTLFCYFALNLSWILSILISIVATLAYTIIVYVIINLIYSEPKQIHKQSVFIAPRRVEEYNQETKIQTNPIQIPVENKTIEVVEKPGKTVYIDRPVMVDRPVVRYVEKPRVSLDIPKYAYIGSTETKTYHTRNCRLGKLIKKKYKIHSNSQEFFKKKKFKACKVCIKK